MAVSCWITRFLQVAWANDAEQMAAHFAQYQRIMEHWQRTLPVPVLDVDYEDMVDGLKRWPAASGFLRPGMGAGVSGVPPHAPPHPNGQRHASAATHLPSLRRPLAALREGAATAVRALASQATPRQAVNQPGLRRRQWRRP